MTKKLSLGILLLGWALAFAVNQAVAQRVQKPLPVEEALTAQSFASRSPIDISPDGAWVAYTLRSQARRERITDERYLYYNRRGVSLDVMGASIRITNTKTGQTKELINPSDRSWGGAWSPDSRYLAFYSDKSGKVGLWVWDKNTDLIRQVSDAVARPFFACEIPQWTPDSKKVMIKVLPEGVTNDDIANMLGVAPQQLSDADKEGVAKVIVYRSMENPGDDTRPKGAGPKPLDYTVRYLADIALIDIENNSVQRIVRGHRPTALTISPDGNSIAFTDIKGRESGSSQQVLHNIVVASVKTGASHIAASNVRMLYGDSHSWSPDSKYLSYVTSGPLTKGDCYIVPADGGEPKNLTDGSHPNLSNYHQQPLWDGGGKVIYWVGDRKLWAISITGGDFRQVPRDLNRDVLQIVSSGKKGGLWSPDSGQSGYIFTRDSNTKKSGVFRVEIPGGRCSKLMEEDKLYGESPAFSTDVSDIGGEIAYISQDAQHYPDIWIAGIDFTSPRRITHTNPRLDKYEMGSSMLIEWRSEDGDLLQGLVLLPVGYKAGSRYPLIVELYEGVNSVNLNRFGADGVGVGNKQLLATRGYAVFLPDIPLRVGSPMRDLAKTVIPGVNKLIDLGIADPDRLGVSGKSYGGYCTVALIVQTTRFKAAVSRAGYGNLFGIYGALQSNGSSTSVGWAEDGQGRMGGTPWQYRDRYIENSPTMYLDRVVTPLMIVHGAADNTVPEFLADELFVCLRRLGKEVIYVKYPGGDHTEASFGYADSVDYFTRYLDWFDKKLAKPDH